MRHWILLLVLLTYATPILAVDGVLEINQVCATQTGCFAGDSAGFPVLINDSGSYRLTSDLEAGSETGLQIRAPAVTLDLNGFSIKGDGTTPFKVAISVANAEHAEIRKGTVENFENHGILVISSAPQLRIIDVRAINNALNGFDIQSTGVLVRGCTASGNGGAGMRVSGGSLVRESIMRNNGGVGLLASGSIGYAQNVITGNNGGDANPQVSVGAIELGLNICGTNTTCP